MNSAPLRSFISSSKISLATWVCEGTLNLRMWVLPGRRQSGTLDLLEVDIVVLSSTTKRRGQRRFSCLVGSKGICRGQIRNVPETCHEITFCAHLAHLAFSRSQ